MHTDRNAPIGVFDSGIGGLTVAREIMRNLPTEKIVYFGDTARVPYGSKSQPLTYVFHFSANILKSIYYFFKWKPDVIITTGTHTAVPMCKIAHRFGKKVIWIETFANATTPTMAGKMIYPIADLFIVQWESMLEVYPNAVYGGWIF